MEEGGKICNANLFLGKAILLLWPWKILLLFDKRAGRLLAAAVLPGGRICGQSPASERPSPFSPLSCETVRAGL